MAKKKFNIRGARRALLLKMWNTTEQIRMDDARVKEWNAKHPDRKRPTFNDREGTAFEALDAIDERIKILLDVPEDEAED